MYEAYWELERRPFQCGFDARFYYPAEAQQGTLLKLRYAVESRHTAALVVGPSGSGKTTVIRLLASQLGENVVPFVHLVFPLLPVGDLLALLADELGATSDHRGTESVEASVTAIRRFLAENASQGRHAVIAIDEAHLLEGNRVFEALRLLTNFEGSEGGGVTLLLAGQPVLLPILARMPQFDERLAVKCLLRPLTLEETMSYVQHRLGAAGALRPIFDRAAMEAVHHVSQGNPRRINHLCDLALLLGFAGDSTSVGEGQIEAVAQELVAVSVD